MTNENREEGRPEISTVTKTKAIQTPFDYCDYLKTIEQQGQVLYGERYAIADIDRPPILKMLCYFLRDEEVAAHVGIDLNKGLFINGPIGCGKTAIVKIICSLLQGLFKPIILACRDMSYEFSQNGFEVIRKYTREAFHRYSGLPFQPITICFDDLGLEPQVSYWGNQCKVMAEILACRYDLFVSDGMITHVTTNLNAKELEEIYGNRLRSRMRQMFNLIAFNPESKDKRR